MPAIEIEVLRLLALVRRQSWRAVVAAEARRDPERFGAITAPGGAAALTLLPLREGQRALVVDDTWGRLAVPLARRAEVSALLPSAADAALLACIAAQEGVVLQSIAGALDAPPLAAGCFDLVLIHGELGSAPAILRGAALLLAPDGVCYATAANALAGGYRAESMRSLTALRTQIADAGLVARHEYACFPDAGRPSALVPLALVADHLRRQSNGAAELAHTGIAEHLVPAFAFVLGHAR